MSETEKPKCHSLAKDEGLTNGGNIVSSNVSDEMTEVCVVDIVLLKPVLINMPQNVKI